METIYGPHWQIPNPGFSWARQRTGKALEGRIPEKAGSRANWLNYWAHTTFAEPSGFCRAQLCDLHESTTVVDLGCGDGRDSVAFAAAGHRVIGLDWCDTGLSRAQDRSPAAHRAARLPAGATSTTRRQSAPP